MWGKGKIQNSALMKTGTIIGIILLGIAWLWLAWALIAYGGFNLKNLLLVAMTGIIIFVPLYKKYGKRK